ncbi:MAG: ABC transporter permease subunit, partial [Tolypothrix sp. Co-bin9]|nr:ABC transporter permease subunit [Tolypothrix sp. Co-bin9]
MYPVTRDRKVDFRPNWDLRDVLLLLALLALIFGIVRTAAKFGGTYDYNFQVETSLNVLPSYTAQTLLRMVLAYFVSLLFTLIYAYAAYRYKVASIILIPLLDILQSIPVLSFLPGVVLALIAIFPGQRIGVELASILLIFTGMTWNMTFSFYQSLCNIPQELIEASRIYRLNSWQRFWTLELPSGVIGLVWNSVMSVAGGWFFLIAIESFTLGNRNFHLPGLGSFLAIAANKGDFGALTWGLLVLIGEIILIDFFIWRPLIAWAEKFKFETVEAQNSAQSIVLDFIRRSPTIRILSTRFWKPLNRAFGQGARRTFPHNPSTTIPERHSRIVQWFNWLFLSGVTLIVLWGTWEAAML